MIMICLTNKNQKDLDMARFVLDIANLSKEEISEAMEGIIVKFSKEQMIVSIRCIDETNENQFYETGSYNVLSDRQIESFRRQVENE